MYGDTRKDKIRNESISIAKWWHLDIGWNGEADFCQLQ